MNKKTIEKLEFDKICELLADYSVTYIGKNLSMSLSPMISKSDIKKAQTQTSEAVTLLYRLGNIPLIGIADITIHLKQLENSNSLNPKQLLDLANILKIAQDLKEYLDTEIINIAEFTNLNKLFENMYTNKSIVKSITSSILDENTIDDNASTELKNIRNQIRKKEQEIQNKLNSFLHSKYIQEPIVTIRNDRFVIPVKNEYRSEVKGFIHDISASGSTVFIEPISIFDINNEIAEFHNKEILEINRILMNLSSLFFNQIENLKNTSNLIGLIDFIFAKAKFSKEFNHTEPIINDDKFINLIDCYHPLIPKDKVVKNSINLGKDFNSLIITGPNTGGKTVILKTVGIIELMAMSGLHIPAKYGSSIFIFDNIFADIGDEQSISDSLSTFSSHITNIAFLLQHATEKSLVLVDELGSGTDPIEGSSLAISILETLNKSNILTIATTHYHEIKEFALYTDGFENASVEFDLKTLTPTYHLLLGVPGRSNAFEISSKLGISNEIIENAKKLITDDKSKIEDLLNSIYEDKRIIEEDKRKIESNLTKIENLKKSYEENNEQIQKSKNEIIKSAKEQAKQILFSVKEDANKIIKELEKSSSSKKSNELRNELNKKIDKLSTETKPIKKQTPLSKNEIKVGMTVEIPSINQIGTIISLPTKDDTVTVQMGIVKSSFNISDLVLTNKLDKKVDILRPKKEFKVASVSPEINVIGQNVEEACFTIDKYLDTCSLNGLQTVRIIHGKGSGKLKKGIQNFLKTHPHVQSFRIGTFGEGESGVTVVELK